MELYNAADGPTLDPGVIARLKRLDRNLSVTFSPYAIDYGTSRPVEVIPGPDWEPWQEKALRRCGNAWFLYDPAFHLWVDNGDGRQHWVKSYQAEGGFDHREVLMLERDAMRFMTPTEYLRASREFIVAEKLKARKDERESRDDVVKANESRIRDLLFGEKTGQRQAKIVSYAGQVSRRTPGTIMTDPKEDGWELRREE